VVTVHYPEMILARTQVQTDVIQENQLAHKVQSVLESGATSNGSGEMEFSGQGESKQSVSLSRAAALTVSNPRVLLLDSKEMTGLSTRRLLNRLADGCHECRGLEWLDEQPEDAALVGKAARLRRVLGGDEDDRHLVAQVC
jgi:hypothetical protein